MQVSSPAPGVMVIPSANIGMTPRTAEGGHGDVVITAADMLDGDAVAGLVVGAPDRLVKELRWEAAVHASSSPRCWSRVTAAGLIRRVGGCTIFGPPVETWVPSNRHRQPRSWTILSADAGLFGH